VSASCKRDDPPQAEAEVSAASAGASDESNASPKDEAGAIGKDTAPTQEAVAVPQGLRAIEPAYPVALDTLLDLVPADADTYFVVRDLGALVNGVLAYADAQRAAMGRLADEIGKTDPGDAADVRQAITLIESFGARLASSGIDLSAGAVLAMKAGADTELLVYGAAKADAFPVMLEALGAKAREIPRDCVVVVAEGGYYACAKTGVAAYAPGKRASALRAQLAGALPGVDLDRANVVAYAVTGSQTLPFALETGQGMALLSLAVPSARGDLAAVARTSNAPSLGIVGPGQPFLWGQLAAAGLIARMGPPEPFLETLVKSLTGELVVGGVAGSNGIVAAIGVTDAAPAAGLIALASLGLGEIPKTLPGGIGLEVGIETVQTERAGVQTIRARLSGSPLEVLTTIGYAPEILAFAGGKLAAITFGADVGVVSRLASDTGAGPRDDLLATLPVPLASALRDARSVFAMHIPVDAAQAPAGIAALEAILGQVPPAELGIDARVAARLLADVLAPLSSISLWITDVDRGPVVHVAFQGFAAPATEEGKEALAALAAIGGGADRESTYAALAAKHPSSARAASYQARAGRIGDSVGSLLVGGVGLGVLGAWLFLVEEATPVEPPPPVVIAPPGE
jgi:hypothetical protein